MSKKVKCLFEFCNRENIYARGLCIAHYNFMNRVIRKGIRTEEELISHGLILPNTMNRDMKYLLEKLNDAGK